MLLTQQKYATEILDHAKMSNYKPTQTRDNTFAKFDGTCLLVADLTLYCSVTGALQYLTFTWTNISYVVQQACIYMHDPKEPQFTTLKRIL